MAAALAARMPSKSPAAIAARVAIQLPLIAKTDGCARYSTAFAADTPPLGMNRTSGKGPVSESIMREPAEPVGREELQLRQPGAQRALHLGRRRDAGQHPEAELAGAGDDLVVDAGADDEPRAGVGARVDLCGREHRAGADGQAAVRCHGGHRIQARRRAQRDLDRA